MSFHFLERTPEPPIDQMIREQAMAFDVPSHPEPSYRDDDWPRAARPSRYCPRCRTWGGHDPRSDC